MPKAKPDQVIVHRLELQETERATLEAALAGKFVTNAAMAAGNLLNGIGAALTPLSGAFQVLAAAWVAERSWDEIVEQVLDPIVELIETPVLEKYAGDYAMIVAWLNAQYGTSGWDFLGQNYSSHDAYFATSEGASTLWRGNYEQSYGFTKLGALPVGTYEWVSATYSKANKQYQMPGWLVDRFDTFIYTMKQNTASDKSKKTPAEWWVQFYPYAEFENEILWRTRNR